MCRNSVSFTVKSFDSHSCKVNGYLEIDLPEPLKQQKSSISFLVNGQRIKLLVPLTQFYIRKLTGRFSIPVTLDLSCHFIKSTPTLANGPAIVFPSSSPTAVDMASKFTRSLLGPSNECHKPSSERKDISPTCRLIALNDQNVSTVWLFGIIPICVVRIELMVMKIDDNIMSLLVKVQSGSYRPHRIIIEAMNERNEVIARMNYPETPQFAYGKVVQLAIGSPIMSHLACLQTRVDIRLARDPKCILRIPSL